MYKFLEVIITPETAFGTPLKGDTLFGHFVWQLIYDPDLIEKDLNILIEEYTKGKPFIIFSSLCFKTEEGWLFPRPSLPLHYFEKEEEEETCFEKLTKRKEKKGKKFIKVKEKLVIEIDEKNLINREFYKFNKRIRNSLNRISWTTREEFSPYEVEEIWFFNGKPCIFCLFKESAIKKEKIEVALTRMGKFGYGKDASLGLGKFKVEEINELPVPEISKYVYTLSPSIPKEEEIKNGWFLPFIRFGKHGSSLATSRNPFKEPIIMADEGAVFILKEEKIKAGTPFIGKAVKNISKVCPETIAQGFSIILPVRF